MEIVSRVSTDRVNRAIYTRDKPFDRDERDVMLFGTIAFLSLFSDLSSDTIAANMA